MTLGVPILFLEMKGIRMSLLNGQIENKLITSCICNGDIVFDVGANMGFWTEEALKRNPSAIHVF